MTKLDSINELGERVAQKRERGRKMKNLLWLIGAFALGILAVFGFSILAKGGHVASIGLGDDATFASAIKKSFADYKCANYFTIGQPIIEDKIMNAQPQLVTMGLAPATSSNTNEAVVEAITPLAKTDEYVQHVEHAQSYMEPCTVDDFDAPSARFNNLARAFQNVPVGTPVNFKEKYRFQKWQSGWRLEGVE